MTDKNADLVYSPDDSGFYWEDRDTWRTSQIFPTEEEARQAMRDGAVVMKNDHES